MNSENRNVISQFIHDFISWLKARLKGEKVSLKIVKLENRFAAVLRNVDNTNAQKNNTTNDGDVQYSNYWYPQMSKTDLEYVKRRAKYELDTTENYIDNITKWLYNVKNGNTYFALYSTEDANEPTILYACKNNRAEVENEILIQYLNEKVTDDGSIHARTEIIDKILKDYKNTASNRVTNRHDAVGGESNGGDVAVHRRHPRIRPSEALFNCLRNIAKISDTNGADLNEGSAFSMPENDDEVSYSFEITPEQDTEYLDAVNNGDMETAQRMVDEAAKDAGYTIKAYHGTTADFNTFDKNKIGQGYTLFASQGFGFYFTESEAVANNSYGKGQRVVGAYLKTKNPFVFIDKNNQKANALLDEFGKQYGRNFDVKDYDVFVDFEKRTGAILSRVVKDKGREFTKFLEEKGYDGITYNSYDYDNKKTHTCHIVFEPNQIKSADAITYDDNGNVIPLSQRFNEDDNDIRYSFEDDVVDKTSSLAERVRLGEISQTEYLNELRQLMDEATEKYGAIPKGENPVVSNLSELNSGCSYPISNARQKL